MAGGQRRKAIANYLTECVVGLLVGGLLITVLAALIALIW
jgi:tetrahydromethanopterin S-methyltransferase subunit B